MSNAARGYEASKFGRFKINWLYFCFFVTITRFSRPSAGHTANIGHIMQNDLAISDLFIKMGMFKSC